MVAKGWGKGNRELCNEFRVLVLQDEKVLEICSQQCEYINSTELYLLLKMLNLTLCFPTATEYKTEQSC